MSREDANGLVPSLNGSTLSDVSMQDLIMKVADLERDRAYWHDQATQLRSEVEHQKDLCRKKASMAEQLAMDHSQLLHHIHQQNMKIEELTIQLSEQHARPAPKHYRWVHEDELQTMTKETEQLRREKSALEYQISKQMHSQSESMLTTSVKFDSISTGSHSHMKLPGRIQKRDVASTPPRAQSEACLQSVQQRLSSNHMDQDVSAGDAVVVTIPGENGESENGSSLEIQLSNLRRALEASHRDAEFMKQEINDLQHIIQKKNQAAEIYAFEKSSMMAKLDSQTTQLEQLTMENADLKYKLRLQAGQVSRTEMEMKIYSYERALSELNQQHQHSVHSLSLEIDQLREERDTLCNELSLLRQNALSHQRYSGQINSSNNSDQSPNFLSLQAHTSPSQSSAPMLFISQQHLDVSKPTATPMARITLHDQRFQETYPQHSANMNQTTRQGQLNPLPDLRHESLKSPTIGFLDFLWEIFWGSEEEAATRVHIV